MIGESMYYLEDEKIDLLMGDPQETDAFLYSMIADEKKEDENETPTEETAEAKEEDAPAEETPE